jgi:hypothetical protein
MLPRLFVTTGRRIELKSGRSGACIDSPTAIGCPGVQLMLKDLLNNRIILPCLHFMDVMAGLFGYMYRRLDSPTVSGGDEDSEDNGEQENDNSHCDSRFLFPSVK